MTRIRTLCIDLDHTLLDHGAYADSVRAACGELAGRLRLDAEALAVANTSAWDGYWTEIEEDYYLGRHDDADVSANVWRRTFAAFGVDDEAAIAHAIEVFARHETAGHRLFDDVADTLASAREAGVRTVIVTNGATEVQLAKIERLGLDAHVDGVVVSAEVGAAKPDPRIFEAAFARVGVDATDAWHVGDYLAADVAGANAAGIGAIWLNRDGAERSGDAVPDLEVRSLREIWAAGW